MLTMLVGVITRTGLAFGSKYPSVPIDMAIVGWITVFIVPVAIFLNYRLFTFEQELVDRSAVQRKFNQPAEKISAEAREHTSVDNIKL